MRQYRLAGWNMNTWVCGGAWLAMAMLASAAQPQQPTGSQSEVERRCQALGGTDLSMLRDAPTQIIATKLVDPQGDAPGYCETRGYVAPNIGFVLRLPAVNWNGKLI